MGNSMRTIQKNIIAITIIGYSVSLLGQSSISKDILIGPGKVSERDVSTVSGDITIGKNARVQGSIETVSGDIEIAVKAKIKDVSSVSGDISIGKNATCNSLESVSGDILLYEGCTVDGSIETVSGDITGNGGCEIFKNIESVSGDVELDDTRLRGDIETVSGDISLFNGSLVEGDIIINRKHDLMMSAMSRVKVVIDMNSLVKGSIRVKEKDTNVIVYLSNGGKVRGEIINAEVIEQ